MIPSTREIDRIWEQTWRHPHYEIDGKIGRDRRCPDRTTKAGVGGTLGVVARHGAYGGRPPADCWGHEEVGVLHQGVEGHLSVRGRTRCLPQPAVGRRGMGW